MNYQFNKELANVYSKFGLTEGKKPDFLDVDGDGDKKESFKQATSQAKGKKKCSCGCVIGKPKTGCKCKKHCK
jgi:hypothetical protein